jgi:hypothetical protein
MFQLVQNNIAKSIKFVSSDAVNANVDTMVVFVSFKIRTSQYYRANPSRVLLINSSYLHSPFPACPSILTPLMPPLFQVAIPRLFRNKKSHLTPNSSSPISVHLPKVSANRPVFPLKPGQTLPQKQTLMAKRRSIPKANPIPNANANANSNSNSNSNRNSKAKANPNSKSNSYSIPIPNRNPIPNSIPNANSNSNSNGNPKAVLEPSAIPNVKKTPLP